MSTTRKLIQRWITKTIYRSISTGSVTAAIALIMMVAYFVNNQSNVPVAFSNFLGRLHTLSVIYNLNDRPYVCECARSDTVESSQPLTTLSLTDIEPSSSVVQSTVNTGSRDDLQSLGISSKSVSVGLSQYLGSRDEAATNAGSHQC
ncbi:hypothetical protein VKT23_009750 [Stygiomarasmius scandens]|uniref:DUF6534 domain-containing protein n=1 Tax=Marasmiellus scandens TaxID=2682957 RepID=A0ABR1JFQ0_9AGAR